MVVLGGTCLTRFSFWLCIFETLCSCNMGRVGPGSSFCN